MNYKLYEYRLNNLIKLYDILVNSPTLKNLYEQKECYFKALGSTTKIFSIHDLNIIQINSEIYYNEIELKLHNLDYDRESMIRARNECMYEIMQAIKDSKKNLKDQNMCFKNGRIIPKENIKSEEIGLDNMSMWECRKRTKAEYITLKDNGFIPNVWDKLTIKDFIKARKESIKSSRQGMDRYDELIKSTINLSQCSIREATITLPKPLEQRLKEVQEKYKQYEKDQTYFIDIAIAANAIWKVYRSIFGFKPKYDIKGILRY